MENKSKFIIIGLVGLSVIFIFLYMQTLNSKQLLQKGSEKLIAENTELSQTAKGANARARQLEDQVNSLSSDLDRLSKERDELQNRLDTLVQEKDGVIGDLTAKLQQAVAEKAEVRQPQPEAPVSEDAYWAGVLKAKTDLELRIGSLKDQLKSSQLSNEQLLRDKNSLELDVKGLLREREDLGRQIEYSKKLMDSIAQEAVRERNDKAQIQNSLNAIKSENAVLRKQLNSLNNRKTNLEKNFQALQEGKKVIEQRLNDMELMLSESNVQINKLVERLKTIKSAARPQALSAQPGEEAVELPPIVVRPKGLEPGLSELGVPEGKILALNKENNFVVIDLGTEAGVKTGDIFQVYRGEERIATIEVIQARHNIAACDIKLERAAIDIGDIVRY